MARKRKPSGRVRLPRSARPPKVETPKKAYRRQSFKDWLDERLADDPELAELVREVEEQYRDDLERLAD